MCSKCSFLALPEAGIILNFFINNSSETQGRLGLLPKAFISLRILSLIWNGESTTIIEVIFGDFEAVSRKEIPPPIEWARRKGFLFVSL